MVANIMVCDMCETPVPRDQHMWTFKEEANVVVKYNIFTVCKECGPEHMQGSIKTMVKRREAKPCSWCNTVEEENLLISCTVPPDCISAFKVWVCRKCAASWYRIQYPQVADLMYLRPQHTDEEISEIERTTKARHFTSDGLARFHESLANATGKEVIELFVASTAV